MVRDVSKTGEERVVVMIVTDLRVSVRIEVGLRYVFVFSHGLC